MPTVVDAGADVSKPGDGDVRRPALAIELRCDSGFGDLRYEI